MSSQKNTETKKLITRKSGKNLCFIINKKDRIESL